MVAQIPDEHAAFMRIGYTIGGMMFPGNRVGGQMTTSGFHPRIKDRFDLTLECIRRHYLNEDSPLSSVMARYADHFSLFGDFRGYVQFFLLRDLGTDDYPLVKFFSAFQNFSTSPVPASIDAHLAYREHAVKFIETRNTRIFLSC